MKKRRCAYCGDEFEAQRRTAKYCCDGHRAAASYARRTGRPMPAEDAQPVLFRYKYRYDLTILRERSPEAAAGMEKIVADYGVKAAEAVLREILVPFNNAHYRIFDHVFEMTSLGRADNAQIFTYLEASGIFPMSGKEADEPQRHSRSTSS